MSERVQITDGGETLRIEIPAWDGRGLAIFWFLSALVSTVILFTVLRRITLSLLPFLLVWALAMVIFFFKGVSSWQWSSRGVEVFTASFQQLVYEREGAIFDRRSVCIRSDRIAVRVLRFGIGDNQLVISSPRRRILCARSISREEASHIRGLLLRRYNESGGEPNASTGPPIDRPPQL